MGFFIYKLNFVFDKYLEIYIFHASDVLTIGWSQAMRLWIPTSLDQGVYPMKTNILAALAAVTLCLATPVALAGGGGHGGGHGGDHDDGQCRKKACEIPISGTLGLVSLALGALAAPGAIASATSALRRRRTKVNPTT
jgi:hypothetical protein